MQSSERLTGSLRHSEMRKFPIVDCDNCSDDVNYSGPWRVKVERSSVSSATSFGENLYITQKKLRHLDLVATTSATLDLQSK